MFKITLKGTARVFILVMFLCAFFSPGNLSLPVAASGYTQNISLTNQTLTLDLNNSYYLQSAFLTPDNTMDIEVADFDNDGCEDAALAVFYNKQQKMFWNNCDGTWTEANLFGTRTGWGIDSADFNADGYLDVVLGTYPGFGGPAGNYLFINNHDRTFTGSVMFGNGNTTNLHAQDINNDGLPDVVVPVAGQCRTYTNNGNGTFASQALLSPVNTMNLKLFDIDKDGDLDVLKSEYSGWTTYNINNGGGSYTSNNVTTNIVSDMQPIDFNKDGNWDFTVAVSGQNYLYVNNGSGSWVQSNQFGARQSNVHSIRDIDGNGYDDVIVGNGAWGTSQQNYVYYNNGDGTFTESAAFGAGSTYAIHFVDIDGDGDEDVVNGNWTANGNQIYYKGYYPTTTKSFSYPVALPSDFVSWDHLETSETKKPGTDIRYSIYPEDANHDGTCNDGSAMLGPVSSSANRVDISSLAAQPICVLVTLSSNRVIATPKLTGLSITYAADSSAPSGLTLDLPSGYTKDTKPTLIFRKAVDTASGMASYKVTLDEGKASSYSTSGIPATGDSTKSSYVWKNDSAVRIEFSNESDGEAVNDTISVYFKDLDANDLAEGRHSWKVTAYDNAGNSKQESKEFYIDRTNPNISELNWTNTSKMPSFSGRAMDSYRQGNEAYDMVSSGPRTISLDLKKKVDPHTYTDYLTRDVTLSDLVDVVNDQKYTRFTISVPEPLTDGLYQATLTLKDEAGNAYSYATINVPINYLEPTAALILAPVSDNILTGTPTPKESPTPTVQEKKEDKKDSVNVQVKVLDKNNKPVFHARVELHSDPMIAYTNEEGIATFENVPTGDHTIDISYANFKGEQKIKLTKDNANTKQFHVDIRVTEEVKKPLYQDQIFIILVFLLIMAVLFGLFVSRKVSAKKVESI